MIGDVFDEPCRKTADAINAKAGAKSALFLASDEASFVTGSELVVDGGYTAQ